jgi:hypothetical protein
MRMFAYQNTPGRLGTLFLALSEVRTTHTTCFGTLRDGLALLLFFKYHTPLNKYVVCVSRINESTKTPSLAVPSPTLRVQKDCP